MDAVKVTNTSSSGRSKLRPSGVARCRVCFRKFFAFLVSKVGLCVLVVAYLFGGAGIFQAIESPYEGEIVEQVNQLRNRTINNLWNITLNYNVFDNDHWEDDVLIEMKIYQRELMKAINDGYEGRTSYEQKKWTFYGAFLFSLTVISTIGYGNIRPQTDIGKLLTIIYAIIGIPLMLLYLTNIGDLLANSFRYVYGRLCSCKQDPRAILIAAEKRCGGIGCGAVCASGNGSGDAGIVPGLGPGAMAIPAGGNGLMSYGTSPPNYSSLNCTGSTILALNGGGGGSGGPGATKNGSNRYIVPRNVSSTSGVMCSTPNNLSGRPILESMFDRSETIGREFDIVSLPKEKIRVPITLCLLIMTSYIWGGGILFSLWENWNYLDGAYFCFITLSTIGFGDLVPGESVLYSTRSDVQLSICSLYILAGMVLLAMCFKLMQEEVIHKIRLFGRKIGIINDSDNHDISADFY